MSEWFHIRVTRLTCSTNHPQEHKEVPTKKLVIQLEKKNMNQLDSARFPDVFLLTRTIYAVPGRACCKDLQPISIVDSPSFLQLLSTLYIPASRTTFSRAIIPNRYASVKDSVLGSLSAATHYSLTTDLWTGCYRRAYRLGDEASLSTDM